ncbi:ribosome maturation protein [Cantharellus anzutake]|uniref:ribosome maturation protein n=1 Tax=Cantharellus anzutake TaxID=1750568 RepID=UPI0019048387|nr:ribosome maturation protein [Cantharellus anzutake]KAF8339206.1 ribosome maturation protein [Cantharellus anzutake]
MNLGNGLFRGVTSVGPQQVSCSPAPLLQPNAFPETRNPFEFIMTGNREKQVFTKVVYKPDTQSTEEFIIIVNDEEYNKWKKGGDTSIPLSRIVDSFDIFSSEQGNQGYLGRASKQQLDSVFGTTNQDEAVKKLLELGKAKPGEGLPKGYDGKNDTRGASKGQVRATLHN